MIRPLALLLAAFAILAQPARADDYPTRPVRLIVGFAAGSSGDVIARIVAHKLSELLNQNVIVEDKPGASSMVATDYVARSAKDGYTLMFATIATTINMTLMAGKAPNVEKDMTPVALVGAIPNILVVTPELGVSDVKGLIALAKQKPDELLYGASGLGTVSLGNSSAVKTGQTAIAVGNAGGTGSLTSTVGKVTAVGRTITVNDDQGGTVQLSGLIGTDAALEPGDSGGPLLNGDGRVVGMNTAASVRFTFRQGRSGGYAIPINRAAAIAKQIEAGRRSATVHVGPTAFLGVALAPPSSTGNPIAGGLVGGVLSGSPADRVGLVPGDVITSLDEHAARSPLALVNLLLRKRPGDKVAVVWIDRAGSRRSATATLANGPPQ